MNGRAEQIKLKQLDGIKAVRELTKLGCDPGKIKDYFLKELSQQELTPENAKAKLESALTNLNTNQLYNQFTFSKLKLVEKKVDPFECLIDLGNQETSIEIKLPVKISFKGNKPKIEIQLENRSFEASICKNKQITPDKTEGFILENMPKLINLIGSFVEKIEETNLSQTIVPILEYILAYSESLKDPEKEYFERNVLDDEMVHLLERSIWMNENPNLFSKVAREFFAYNFITIMVRKSVSEKIRFPKSIVAQFADTLFDLSSVIDTELEDEYTLSKLLAQAGKKMDTASYAQTNKNLLLYQFSLITSSAPFILGMIMSVIYKHGQNNYDVEEILASFELLYNKYQIFKGIQNQAFEPDFWRSCIEKTYKASGFSESASLIKILDMALSKKYIEEIIDNFLTVIKPAPILSAEDDDEDDETTELENTELSKWDTLLSRIPDSKAIFNVKPKNANKMVVSLYIKRISKILDILDDRKWDLIDTFNDKRAKAKGTNYESYEYRNETIFTAQISRHHRLQMKQSQDGRVEIFGVSGHPGE